MQFDSQQYPHGDLTEKIIGAAMAAHRALGPGLDEKIYENALCLEFLAQAIDFSQQQQFPVFYRKKIVGTLITDLIVEGKVIIEAKVAASISDAHLAQNPELSQHFQAPSWFDFKLQNSSPNVQTRC